MTETAQNKTDKKSFLDWTLLLIVAALVVWGLIMQYSASSYNLELVLNQGGYALGGFAVLFIVSFVPVRFLYKLSVIAFAGAMAATAATLVIGKVVKGARRWVKLGPITFQPSEILKAALIMMLAMVLCKFFHEINQLEQITVKEMYTQAHELGVWNYLSGRIAKLKEKGFLTYIKERRGLLYALLVMVAAAGFVVVLTKDLGTAVIIFGIGFCMLLVISPDFKYLIVILLLAAAAAIGFISMFDYRKDRIDAWLHLAKNESDLGYQIQQGLYAIGSGGWFGRGLGKSIQKDFLPEPQTDMIYAVVCEELGIIGGIILIVLFVLLILRLRKIYIETADLYGKMIITGVTAHIGIQAVINMAVVANLIPNTGVPLPFISYGGTSVLILLTEIGMVMSVRRKELDRLKNSVYDTSYSVENQTT